VKGFNVMNVVGATGAIIAMITAIITADSRYIKTDELQDVKNEIIGEMRREVARNRSILIGSLQRSADDIEFQISEYENNKKPVPRFLIEKNKQLNRLVEDLQSKIEEK